MINGAIEQHPVGLGADPRPRLQPVDHLSLHSRLCPLRSPYSRRISA